MPGKNAQRDNVAAVRTRLPQLSNLSREKIQLALLHYESIDATVEAFERDGAADALNGWTEMTHDRGHNANKRSNNKSNNRTNKSQASAVPPSNGHLRPSQRVHNILQTFADGGVPTLTSSTNGNTPVSTATPSSSSMETTDISLQFYPTSDLPEESLLSNNINPSSEDEFHPTSSVTSKSSITVDHQQMSTATQLETSTNDLNASNASETTVPTVNKSSNSTTFSDNRKVLTKSAKDLQRQTSTLSNVEMSFENEIKSSIKRIDDVFKQIREIIQEREVELYLEMDKVKEQGLAVIHRRQQRALELRQRMDRCDRLEANEIDHLRTDVKQFVTDRRYDLGEELTSSHRFEYDQNIIEGLKHFGTVLRIDRPRTMSTSSPLVDTNGTSIEKSHNNEKTSDTPSINGQSLSSTAVSSPSNEQPPTIQQQQQPLPQRTNHRQQNFNGHNAGDYHNNSYSSSQTNGYHHHYYDDSNSYQTVHRRRTAPPSGQQQPGYPGHHNGNNTRRQRPPPSSTNNNNHNRRNGAVHNSETTNTYRRPRPTQTIVSPVPAVSQ